MTEETEEDVVEDEAIEEEVEKKASGYTCVNCESDVDIDPVEEKVICPSCSHRVLLKKRPETQRTVEAV